MTLFIVLHNGTNVPVLTNVMCTVLYICAFSSRYSLQFTGHFRWHWAWSDIMSASTVLLCVFVSLSVYKNTPLSSQDQLFFVRQVLSFRLSSVRV